MHTQHTLEGKAAAAGLLLQLLQAMHVTPVIPGGCQHLCDLALQRSTSLQPLLQQLLLGQL